jgi:hypothetical protein
MNPVRDDNKKVRLNAAGLAHIAAISAAFSIPSYILHCKTPEANM